MANRHAKTAKGRIAFCDIKLETQSGGSIANHASPIASSAVVNTEGSLWRNVAM